MSQIQHKLGELAAKRQNFENLEGDAPAPAEAAAAVTTPASPASDASPPPAPHADDGHKELAKDGKKKVGDGKSSIAGAVFNLANAIIGAGVGGMPYALKEAGFYGGMFLLVVVAMCSDYTVRMIVRLGVTVKRKYYEDLVQSQFGHAGYVFVVSAMGIFAYGAMVAYLIGIGDNMSIVVAHWSGTHLETNMWIKRITLTALAIGAVLPLAMLKNMSALSKTSFISLLSVIFIIGVVITRAITGPGDARVPVTDEERELLFIDTNFFPAVGIIAFAFVCHHACFIVYNTLRDNTEARWNKTVHLSLGVALTVMFTLAVAAYLTFRGVMKGSFLTNYSYRDELCNVMRCMFAVAQTLTYPLELFVTRHCIHALMFPAQKWTNQQHYVITLLLWGSTLAISLNVADLSAVLELTGGVAAVSIGFCLPAILHFKMSKRNWKCWRARGKELKDSVKEFAPSYFVLILGILAMVFTVITMAGHIMHHEGEPHDAFEAGHGNGIAEQVGDKNSTEGIRLLSAAAAAAFGKA